MILYARGKRSSIRRPCGRTMQVDRIGDNVRVPPVGLHHVQECLPVLSNREGDRKSTRLNSSHSQISYAVFCWKKKRSSVPTCRLAAEALRIYNSTQPPHDPTD